MSSHLDEMRVLAIDPDRRGFGYVILEGPDFLVDWGIREVSGPKNAACIRAVAGLIKRYEPEVLVLEDPSAKGCWRRQRVRRLLEDLTELGRARGLRVRLVSRANVRRVFAQLGATNKYQVAKAIAERFPELASRTPPERKRWMNEDSRTAIFDAAAFALTLFAAKEPKQAPANRDAA